MTDHRPEGAVAGRRTKRATRTAQPPPLPADGTIVDVVMADRDRHWLTRVEATADRTMCVVAPLREDGELFPLQPGTPLFVGWPTEVGFLKATCTLRGRGEEVIATWMLDVVRVERQQRRSSYRLELSAPVMLGLLGRAAQGRICDVSEGGLRCSQLRRSAPDLGETVDLELRLPDEPPVVARATVVRQHETSATQVELGLRFVVIDAEDVERLRRFIFEEQLRRRAVT